MTEVSVDLFHCKGLDLKNVAEEIRKLCAVTFVQETRRGSLTDKGRYSFQASIIILIVL